MSGEWPGRRVRPGRSYRFAVSVLKAATILLPARFRARFTREIVDTFEDRAARVGFRPVAVLLLLTRTSLDLLRTSVSERFHPTLEAAPPAPPTSEHRWSLAHLMDFLTQSLRFSFRSLARRPGFTAVAVLTLALGVGANTAIFSVVNGVLLRPLPYPEADRLLSVRIQWRESGVISGSLSQPDIHDLEAQSASIESLAGYSGDGVTLTGMGEPEAVRGAQVTKGLLSTFGLAPLMGRDILAEENVPDGPNVVVISHPFWTTRMGRDPQVLGKTLTFDGTTFEIVGVAPEGFEFPTGALFWKPYHLNTEDCGRGCQVLGGIGRLAPGASVAMAQEEVTRIAAGLEEAYVDSNYDKGFRVEQRAEMEVEEVRTALLVLLASVMMVLLIACANVANLLLVRGAARTGEVAVRSALGAGRGRVLAQLLMENLVLAIMGGGLGLLLAYLGLGGLLRLAPTSLPHIDQVHLDGTVLLFTLGTVVFVALLFGLAPALRLARTPLSGALNEGGRARHGRRGQDRSRSLLLVGEVALSLMLLLGSGLLLRSFAQLSAVDLGFEPEGLLRFNISLPEVDYETPEENILFFETLEERIGALPGVRAVGSIFGSPMGRVRINASFEQSDRPPPPPGQEPASSWRVVTPEYFETMGIPLLAGRLLEPQDRLGTQPVMVVSQRFVDRFYPGEEVLGKPILPSVSLELPEEEPRTVVGVVEDARYEDPSEAPEPMMYVPQAQVASDYMTLLVRSAPGTSPLAAVRELLWEMDPNLPLRYVEEMPTVVARELGPARFNLLLLTVFAGLAVLLAAVGLYGVVAYLVSQRTREIAIRMALGAKGEEVTRMVLGQGVRPAMVGIVIGLGGALVGGRVLASLLYNVSPTDPLSFAGATILLVGIATLAVLVPATRASRVAPMSALKQE